MLSSSTSLRRYPAEVGDRKQTLLHLRRSVSNALTMGVGDAFALTLALAIAGVIRMLWEGAALVPRWSWYLPLVWWCGAALLRLLPGWGLGPVEELRRLILLLAVVFGGSIVVLFLSERAAVTSRLTLSLAFLSSVFTVPLVRLRMKRLLISLGEWGVPTMIYGAGHTGAAVVRVLQKEKGMGYYPVGACDDDESLWGTYVEDIRVLGGTEYFTTEAPVAILAMPGISRERTVELLEGPLSLYRHVIIIPDLFEAPSLWVKPRDLGGLLGLEISCNLAAPVSQILKRAMDLFLVVVTMPIWVPLCLVIALAIWLQDGHSPLFLQKRIGTHETEFQTLKFRTMVHDAETVLQQKLAEDPELREEWMAGFKLKNDPRITPVGRFLRRTSLDELPQFINVLKGEMSLVGPRPLPPYHNDDLPRRVHKLRCRVRPGITGLWQVTGRSDSGTKGMVRWDPYYVRNWSIWLDIVVLVRTVRAVSRGRGAY